MYEVGVVQQFEAAHHLDGNFGPATRTHGHTYKVEVAVRGERLQADGTLCDIGKLGEALKNAIGELHLQDLNALEAFGGRNTTAEVVAEHILGRVRPSLPPNGLSAITVRVWESPNAYAAVEEPLNRPRQRFV